MTTYFTFEPHPHAGYHHPQQKDQTWGSYSSPGAPNSTPERLPSYSSSYQTPQLGFDVNNSMNIISSMPCAFNNLHGERAYLLNILQHENAKATEILRTLTPLEENLKCGYYPYSRKRMKKKIAWFKQRLRETSQQEKTILAQLGQVTHQIQRQERMAQVKNEYLFQFSEQMQGMCKASMNPAVPAFQPRSLEPTYFPTEWQQYHGGQWTWGEQHTYAQEIHEEEICPKDQRKMSVRVEELARELSSDSNVRRPPGTRRTMSEPVNSCLPDRSQTFSPLPKRSSLPTVPDISPIWRLTEEERSVRFGSVVEEIGMHEAVEI